MFRIPQLYLMGLLAVVVLIALSMPLLAAETAKGQVKTVDVDKNQLVVADDNNKKSTFDVEKLCKVFLNGKEAKLADLQADDVATITFDRDGEKLTAREIRCTRK